MEIFNKYNIIPNDMNLFLTAFTHSSYCNENKGVESYERLEFLGDKVIDFVVSEYLYKERHLKEGLMTKMRARYVCEEALATYAHDLKFESDIKLGGCEAETGPNNTILADVFEAFIAATYLDMGLEFTKKMVLDIITKYIDKNIDFLHDYKSTLQELVQTDKKSVVYEIIKEEGPSHNKTFICQVKVDGHIMGTGQGCSKKAAEQEAAKEALSKQAK